MRRVGMGSSEGGHLNGVYIAIWVSFLASALQTICYSIFLTASTEPASVREPGSSLFHLETYLIKCGPMIGLLFGFCLTWPFANAIGRRKSLLASNVLVLLAPLYLAKGYYEHLALVSVPGRTCLGAHISLQFALYLLYIFETTPRAWRPFAILSSFVARSLMSTMLVPEHAERQDHRPSDMTVALLHVLTFIPIPVMVQTGGLVWAVESPGWTAVVDGNLAKAEANANLFRFSTAELDELKKEGERSGDDGDHDGDGDPAPVRKLGIKLAAVALLLVPLNGGQLRVNRLLLSIPDDSSSSRFDESTQPIRSYLSPLLLMLVWVSAFGLGARLSGKLIYFGSLAGVIISSFVNIILLLIVLPLTEDSSSASANDKVVWWWVYLGNVIASHLSGLLVTSTFILLMELAGQSRGRAKMLFVPLLFMSIQVGFVLLVSKKWHQLLVTPETLVSAESVLDWLPGDYAAGLKWRVRLALNIFLIWAARRLWRLVK